MNIKIEEGFPQEANVGIAEITVVLRELFEKYEQLTAIEETMKVTGGPVIMPLLKFEKKRIQLKSNSIKNTHCCARFVVYSKQQDSKTLCPRFIFSRSCGEYEETLKKLPAPLRDAYFDKDGDQTLASLLNTLGSIKSDRVGYFYGPVSCEGVVTHAFAVVHEFGPQEDPYCVCTSYLSVGIGK